MTIDKALAVLRYDDLGHIAKAGPAVLRLHLLEVSTIAHRRATPDRVLEAAEFVAAELRRLIAVRPCISLVDVTAREKVFGK